MATKKKRKKGKNRKRFESEWALVKSFVCSLGDYLTDDCGLSPSLAMHKAWMTERLLEKLGKRKVSFMYRKEKDGSVRRAVGTLNEEASEGLKRWYDEHRRQTDLKAMAQELEETKPNCFRYWDEKAHNWRTFKAENLIWYDEDDE